MQKAASLIFVIEDVKGFERGDEVVWHVEPCGKIGIVILGLRQNGKAVLAKCSAISTASFTANARC